jgi:hypothetical protein
MRTHQGDGGTLYRDYVVISNCRHLLKFLNHTVSIHAVFALQLELNKVTGIGGTISLSYQAWGSWTKQDQVSPVQLRPEQGSGTALYGLGFPSCVLSDLCLSLISTEGRITAHSEWFQGAIVWLCPEPPVIPDMGQELPSSWDP